MREVPGAEPGAPTISEFDFERSEKYQRSAIVTNFEKIVTRRPADIPTSPTIIESGVNKNPTIETLTKIAKAVKVRLDDLIN